jgi:hypothetical protein
MGLVSNHRPPGGTLGPGIVWGFLVGQHAASHTPAEAQRRLKADTAIRSG